jgi:hypothetical protein
VLLQLFRGLKTPSFCCAFACVPASRSLSLASHVRYDFLITMLRTLPFALLLELFAHVCASPVANAPHPMITQRAELFRRDVAPGFIGYYNTTDDSGNPVCEPHYIAPPSMWFVLIYSTSLPFRTVKFNCDNPGQYLDRLL